MRAGHVREVRVRRVLRECECVQVFGLVTLGVRYRLLPGHVGGLRHTLHTCEVTGGGSTFYSSGETGGRIFTRLESSSAT